MGTRLISLLLAATSCFATGEFSGRRAPSFALPDTNINLYDILDYRGKVLLLEFISANCPHCRDVAPVYEKVKAKYGAKVAILSVVTYPPDDQTTVAKYIQDTQTTVPVLFDCGQVTRAYLKVTPKDSQREFPHLFLIDAAGMIRNDFIWGPDTKEVFAGPGLFAEIDKLLGHR
jgi:peroxiredoxin